MTPQDHEPGDLPFGPESSLWAIFWISVLGLFVELMLIRWIATEIRIFAYLQNTILVVCFLGLGMGCYGCRRPISMRESLVGLLLLIALLTVPATREALGTITQMLSVLSDLVIWFPAFAESPIETFRMVTGGLVLTFGVMLLVWSVFVPIGQTLGRLMRDPPRLVLAYSVNVAGSLAGVWLFVGLSALSTSPTAWVATTALLYLPFLRRNPEDGRVGPAILALAVAISWFAGVQSDAFRVVWSPYQKLTVHASTKESAGAGTYYITVNNLIYQGMIDLGARGAPRDPKLFPPAMEGLSQYDLPFLFHPSPRTALLVGAGSGNDAAGALRNGVTRTVAVEIDPTIISLGKELHPERPYDHPGVQVVNDDARSYFATTRERFDVISFGLLDSHTTSVITNTRLDHYVYTRESLTRARALLEPGGVMVLTFEAQTQYIADRMARVIREAFGEAPLVFRIPVTGYGWGGVMMVAGDRASIQAQLAKNGRLAATIERWKREYPLRLPLTTPVTTDDWPYIYLETPRVPLLYFLLAGLLAGLLLLGGARLGLLAPMRAGWSSLDWHFFFLGAAFLLLEVQNVSKACVVLGSTWLVNAVIVSSVLLMILLANAVASRFPALPRRPVYLLLAASCLLLYVVDLAGFAFLPYATKALLVGCLTCLPMLFGGIVFIGSFAISTRRDAALGANLLGSLVGGMLQACTFVTGIRALQLIVLAFYLLAFWTRPRNEP